MASILEMQVNVHLAQKNLSRDIKNMIIESCTIEEIATNPYLSEAMK